MNKEDGDFGIVSIFHIPSFVFIESIEEFMQTDEVRSLYIPVRLFRLQAEVQSISQLLIQQINHRPARFRIQVVAGVK